MAKAQFAKCELTGMDSALVWLKDIKKGVKDMPVVFLQAVAEHAVRRSIANAPIETGKLRTEIKHTAVRRLSRGLAEVEIHSDTVNPRNGFNYAYFQHEFQIFGRPADSPVSIPPAKGPSIEYKGTTYTRGPVGHGPITAAQPMTPEGGAGGKYIERSVYGNYNAYRDLLRRITHRALAGGDVHMFANYFSDT